MILNAIIMSQTLRLDSMTGKLNASYTDDVKSVSHSGETETSKPSIK
jgi:hypothetical protein